MLVRAGADGPQGSSALAFFCAPGQEAPACRLRPTPGLPFVGPMVGAILIVLVLLALAAACAVWIPRLFGSFQTQLAERNAEFDRRLESVGAAVDRRLAELDTKVDRRLENASQTTVKIHER